LAINGIIDNDTMLLADPRTTRWRDALSGAVIKLGADTLEKDRSPISEVLNVAWAMHELYHSEAMFSWFERYR
jgi:hypothetical protein